MGTGGAETFGLDIQGVAKLPQTNIIFREAPEGLSEWRYIQVHEDIWAGGRITSSDQSKLFRM